MLGFFLPFTGMWGFHDRQLLLRKLLSDALTHSPASEAFKRRWRYQQTMVNRFCNLVLSEKEWEDDWRFLIQLSSAQPRTSASKRSTDPLSRFVYCRARVFEWMEVDVWKICGWRDYRWMDAFIDQLISRWMV